METGASIHEISRKLRIDEGIIFTWDDKDTFGAEGIGVKVIPVWKWLLE